MNAKRKFLQAELNRITAKLLIFLVFSAFSYPAAAKAVDVAMDFIGIPFFLDDEGHVWAFKEPLTLERPFQIPGLENIKRISAYIALNKNGEVFTWSLKNSSRVTGTDISITAEYAKPEKIGGLGIVGDVLYAENRFVVVSDKNKIIDWDIIHSKNPPAIGVDGYGPKRVIYSGSNVEKIDASGVGTIALLDDGSVIGVGLSETGQQRSDAIGRVVTLKIDNNVSGVYLSKFHSIILNKDGIPKFWGGCDIEDSGPKPNPKLSAIENGKVSNVPAAVSDVETIFPSSNDNYYPDLFLKKMEIFGLNLLPLQQVVKVFAIHENIR